GRVFRAGVSAARASGEGLSEERLRVLRAHEAGRFVAAAERFHPGATDLRVVDQQPWPARGGFGGAAGAGRLSPGAAAGLVALRERGDDFCAVARFAERGD